MRNIYIDGGTKRDLACMVDEEAGLIKLRRIRKSVAGSIANFEYEALLLSLSYIQKRMVSTDKIVIHSDSTEIVRFARQCKSGRVRTLNKLRRRCLRKILQVSLVTSLSIHWTPRKHNLAGRILEYYRKRRIPKMEFIVKWYPCKRCPAKYIQEGDLERHIYNRHIMFSS